MIAIVEKVREIEDTLANRIKPWIVQSNIESDKK
jgi:hypothetical protein